MTLFHGTTSEVLRSIMAQGLRQGSFVSPDRGVAEFFARARARWRGTAPVILAVRPRRKRDVSPVRADRSGRPEARILRAMTAEAW